MHFQTALGFVLAREAGYVNHPADRGGPTNHGITQRTYDAYQRSIGALPQSVKLITDTEVETIYRLRYWQPIKGDSLPWPLALAVFDWAVNSGPETAVKHLQRLAGVDDDGQMGPVTLAASASVDVDLYIDERARFYGRIIEADPTQKVFEKGWANRLVAMREACQPRVMRAPKPLSQ